MNSVIIRALFYLTLALSLQCIMCNQADLYDRNNRQRSINRFQTRSSKEFLNQLAEKHGRKIYAKKRLPSKRETKKKQKQVRGAIDGNTIRNVKMDSERKRNIDFKANVGLPGLIGIHNDLHAGLDGISLNAGVDDGLSSDGPASVIHVIHDDSLPGPNLNDGNVVHVVHVNGGNRYNGNNYQDYGKINNAWDNDEDWNDDGEDDGNRWRPNTRWFNGMHQCWYPDRNAWCNC